ncbi:MAG: nucleotidyltransferase domain-containing protein [Bacteroidetes bacterium]|nr:nucleotidyltransferase domain-containing protein [Bacteroidota bacterium]MCL5027989.1 nucleotidyltransferase domain-containing protein [Bacteroidota bacterium]
MDRNFILKALKKHLLDNFGDAVKEVILFGSQTQGNSTEDSDYDVLIILDREYNWNDENKILDLCYDINLKYNILIDAHIISQNEINSLRGRQPIFINAINSGLYA